MVPKGSDQIIEETSSEVVSDRGTRGGEEIKEAPRRGVRLEVWRIKPKVDEGKQSGSSATSVNIASMLLPIQAVGCPNCS